MPEFFKVFGTEEPFAAALENARWPDGFHCPACGGAAHCDLHAGEKKLFQCNACRHQTTLIAGTIFKATKLRLKTWFLAIHLISQAKTGLSSLSLKRQLCVSYPTAWLVHHKLIQAMAERDACYTKIGKVQVDDAYLGGKRCGGKVGRGYVNKVAFVAAVSMSDEGHPMRIMLNTVSGLKLKAIAAWARKNLAPGSTVYSNELACFSAVTKTGGTHERTVVGGRKPKEVPQLQWINTVLGNLKNSLSASYHSFGFSKYTEQYFGAFAYRFNRRFNLHTLAQRLLVAACSAGRIRNSQSGVRLIFVANQAILNT